MADNSEKTATLNEYDKAHQELSEIRKMLGLDIDICQQEATKSTDQFWRRAYARATFAYIEAATHRMKLQAFHSHNLGQAKYTVGEVAIILEETYGLNDKGEPVKKQSFDSLDKNIRFAFNVYAHSWGGTFSVDCSDHRWDSFKKALKIRHRVTHPKNLEDLVIIDKEMSLLTEALEWFVENEIKLQLSVRETLLQENERLKKELAEREAEIAIIEQDA